MTTGDAFSPGILSLICSFCSKKELKQLAITSKALSAPAIQKLWRALPSFVPLVYTLPPDAWKSNNARVSNVRYSFVTERSFMLKRPLVAADFDRLRLYAPLVKFIAEPPNISILDVLSPSVWTSFQEQDIGSLFNLSLLHYVSLSPSEETQQQADPIHNFIGPSLLKFCLILQGGKDYDDLIQDPEGLPEARPDPVLLDIIAHLSSHCPRLRHFELDTTPFPFYATNTLSDAVCRWSDLRSFEAHTCPLRPEALKHLAALPSLRLLDASIDLPPEDLGDILLPHSEAPLVFPVLHELAIHAPRLAICTKMLELIESTILAKISIYAYAHASPEDIEGLFSLLATCGPRDTITNLLVKPGCTTHSPPPSPPSPPPPPPSLFPHGPTPTPSRPSASRAPSRPHAPLPQTTFTPLLSLGSLRKLSLLGPCFSALHEATLTAIAQALPLLDTAVLCPDANNTQTSTSTSTSTDTRMTLAGLDALARFTNLRSAQLSLADVDEQALADAFARQLRRPALGPNADPGPDDSVEGQGTTTTTTTSLLWCLAVGHARIAEECVEGTAAVLSAWFPRLTATSFAFDVDNDSDEAVLHGMGFRDGDDAVEVRDRWWRVGELVCSFASVREQERRWAADHHPAPT